VIPGVSCGGSLTHFSTFASDGFMISSRAVSDSRYLHSAACVNQHGHHERCRIAAGMRHHSHPATRHAPTPCSPQNSASESLSKKLRQKFSTAQRLRTNRRRSISLPRLHPQVGLRSGSRRWEGMRCVHCARVCVSNEESRMDVQRSELEM
jgi:hypothetical protein